MALVMTPEMALACRDGLIRMWKENPARLSECFRWKHDKDGPEELAEAVCKNAARAEVLIWKKDIFLAAVSGADSFLGQTPSAAGVSFRPSIWNFTPFLLCSEEMCGQFEVPRGTHIGSFHIHADSSRVAFVAEFAPIQPGASPAFRAWAACEYSAPIESVGLSMLTAAAKFLDTDFVGKERASLPRHLRRAAELGRRPPLPEINTVTLRRAWRDDDKPKGDGEPREWSCQWIVGGHWRNQWYPSKAEWKPKYIAPYLKGDPDKPLREPKGPVYCVTR